MNPESRLCSHLAHAAPDRVAIAPEDVLEWLDGPVVVVFTCRVCEATALGVLLDWSRTRRVRAFGLAALPADAVALFRRNLERGSCDLGRASLEHQALFSAAGPAERLIVLDVDTDTVVGSATLPGRTGLPDEPWEARVPAATDDRWFPEAGLVKDEL